MHHLIINPKAGTKKMQRLLERVKKLFTDGGLEFDVHFTTHARDAEEVARELTSKGEQNLIVVGGDGTLHETLNGIVDPTKCRLGLIPAGTGNDFAVCANIPLDAEEAAMLIVKGEVKETDYLEVGGVRCMNVAGMGIDVDVLERCQKGKLKGKLKYLLSLIQSVFAFKGCKITVESDGVKKEKRALIAAACNGRQIGGGIPVCPVADIADGKLDVVTVGYLKGFFKLLGALIKLMKGEILNFPETEHFLCDKVKVTSAKPQTVQMDGELYKDLVFDVAVKSGLKMYR